MTIIRVRIGEGQKTTANGQVASCTKGRLETCQEVSFCGDKNCQDMDLLRKSLASHPCILTKLFVCNGLPATLGATSTPRFGKGVAVIRCVGRWKGDQMKSTKFSFSIENLLVIIAILMILTATFAPQVAKCRNEAAAKAAHAGQTLPRSH